MLCVGHLPHLWGKGGVELCVVRRSGLQGRRGDGLGCEGPRARRGVTQV